MEEISFTYTREDQWHYQLYILLRPPIGRVIVLFVGLILIFWSLSSYLDILFSLLLFLLLTVCLVGIDVLLARRRASKAAQEFKERGVYSLTISEQGIQIKNELGYSTTSWRTIKGIREDKHNLYFLETDDSVEGAFMIPRRAFVSPQGATSFLERARGYWREQSRQTAAPNIP